MKNKFIKIITAAFLMITGVTVFTTPAFAIDPFCGGNLTSDMYTAMGCDSENDDLSKVVQNILKVVINISSTIAVIAIIIAGVYYMTSAGDSGKTKKAKDTILYAVIGLIICALAYVIVNYIIDAI